MDFSSTRIRYLINYLYRIGFVALFLAGATACAATIFRTPNAINQPANKLGMIIIPKNILLTHIDDHRYGRCYADPATKCALQLAQGDYEFEAKNIETSLDVDSYNLPTVVTNNNNVYNAKVTVIRRSASKSDISNIPMTIKENSYYGFEIDKNRNITMIEYVGADLDKIKKDFKDANFKDLRSASNYVLRYVVKEN